MLIEKARLLCSWYYLLLVLKTATIEINQKVAGCTELILPARVGLPEGSPIQPTIRRAQKKLFE